MFRSKVLLGTNFFEKVRATEKLGENSVSFETTFMTIEWSDRCHA